MIKAINMKNILDNIKSFFIGAFDMKRKSVSILNTEANNEMDNFLLICFADNLGIPLPISYYTLELLPYLEEDMDRWVGRMAERKDIWLEKFGEYDMDP